MRNRIIVLFILFSISFTYSQEQEAIPFYKKPRYFVSACGTLVKNPDWYLVNWYIFDKEEGETLFNIGGFLIRNGFEVAYTEDILLGVGLGLDFQFNEPYGKLFTAPAYFQTRVHLPIDRESPFFVKGGIGKLLKLGKSFEKGNYYNLGLGYDFMEDSDRYVISVLLEFHHKKIPTIVFGGVNSVSIGVGFRFL